MYGDRSFIAVIPARGGSKRLPGKNKMLLSGKTLIAWTIEAALKSRYIDTVCVSTDDESIAEISLKTGAEVPFIRPSELATDSATTIDVIKHCVDYYKEHFTKTFDFIVLLQPTSPLRDTADIDSAIEFCIEKNANAIISVCEVEHSPLWCNVLPDDFSMDNFISDEVKSKRSQDLPKYYRINGAIYVAVRELIYKENTFFLSKNVFAYVMTKMRSVDIDDEIDFRLAEAFMNYRIDNRA